RQPVGDTGLAGPDGSAAVLLRRRQGVPFAGARADAAAVRVGCPRSRGAFHRHQPGRETVLGEAAMIRPMRLALCLLLPPLLAPASAFAQEKRTCQPADLAALGGWRGVW